MIRSLSQITAIMAAKMGDRYRSVTAVPTGKNLTDPKNNSNDAEPTTPLKINNHRLLPNMGTFRYNNMLAVITRVPIDLKKTNWYALNSMRYLTRPFITAKATALKLMNKIAL